MNEELQKALAETIDKATQATDFIVSETPEVVQQLLTWKMYESIVANIISILALVGVPALSLMTFRILRRKFKNSGMYSIAGISEGVFTAWVIASAVACLTSIIFCFGEMNLDWLKILLAPKVYLIDYAASILK